MPAAPSTPGRALACLVALVALVATSACTVGGGTPEPADPVEPAPSVSDGPGSASSGEPTDEPDPGASSAEPEPGTTSAASAEATRSDLDVGAPAGWTVWQVDRLVFAVPPGMEPSQDNSIPSSSVTFVPPPNDDGETLGALAVFVETGAVGPLAVRTSVLEDVRTDQTGTEPLEPATSIEVPGSAGASLLRFRYDVDVPETGRSTESVQADVTVQVPDPGPQYGAFLSASTEILSLEDLDTFSSSFRVVDAPAVG